jgi:hypothetical protein
MSTFSNIDCKNNFDENVHCVLSDTGNILIFEDLKCGWSSDSALFPKVTIVDIENYLINSSHRSSDALKMECYRQYIRGLNFYKEKYIHKVMINNISETCRHCYIKSK